MDEKLCEYCDKPIADPRKNQKYHPNCYRLSHNKRCSDRSHNKLLKQSPIIDKTCPVCHNPYQTMASRDAVTCKNVNCKNIWHRRKRKEAWAKIPIEERRAINKIQYQKYTKHNPNHNNFKTTSQTLECICPGCRRRHMHTFSPAWLGVGTPRIGCSRWPACIQGEKFREDKTPATIYNSSYDASWECERSSAI